MKAFDIIGYSFDGALYHDGCQPADAPQDELGPIFASTELEPLDYCDTCLNAHIRKSPGTQAPLHVFLDEDAAAKARTPATQEEDWP